MRWILVFVGLWCGACGTKSTSMDSVDADPTNDVPTATTVDGAAGGDIGAGLTCGENWAQGYCIKFTFHGQKFDGRSFTVQRDLTGTSSTVVFGDTHMTPPAASLAIHDTWQLGPYKDPLDMEIVFGNLVDAPGFPSAAPKAADYPFACLPPYIDISYGNVRYRSTCPGLTGDINVKTWSASPGGAFSGTFSGHLQQYLPPADTSDECGATTVAAACKFAVNTLDVEGTFGLTLPQLNSDLAP